MKQSITKEQWDELSEKEQLVIMPESLLVVFAWEDITIGQMIEFLGDEWWKCDDDAYRIFTEDSYYGVRYIGKEELADSLWEAVKYKLKQ